MLGNSLIRLEVAALDQRSAASRLRVQGQGVPKPREPANPFYVLVVIVGVAFLITAFAYGTMAWRATQPRRQAARPSEAQDAERHGRERQGPEQHPLLVFLDHHGITVLAAELVVLGVATVAAMGLDQRRSRRADSRCERGPRILQSEEEPPIE